MRHLLVCHSCKFPDQNFAESGGDPETLNSAFPSFLWLVRDFALKLKDEQDNDITPRDYLENVLREKAGEKQKEKNDIRRAIKQFFPSRDCLTLVRPVVDESQLQAIDKIKFGELRAEFRNQMNHMKGKVYAEVQPKRVLGRAITGRGFASLIKSYVEAVNKGGVPAIHTAFHAVALIENQQAFDSAVAAYSTAVRDVIEKKLPLDEAVLAQLHTSATQNAIQAFVSAAVGDDTSSFQQKLGQFFEQEFLKHTERNGVATRKQAAELLEKLVAPLHEQMRLGKFNNMDELMHAWTSMQSQYSKTANGSAAAIIDTLNRAIPAHLHKLVVAFSTRMQAQSQAKLDAQRKREDELNQKIVQVREEAQIEKDTAHKVQLDLATAMEQAKSHMKDLNTLQSEKKQMTAAASTAADELNKLRQELTKESYSRREVERDLQMATAKLLILEEAKLGFSKKFEETEKRRVALDTKSSVLEEKLANQKEMFEASIKSFKDKISSLERDLGDLRSQRDDASKGELEAKGAVAALEQESKKNKEIQKANAMLEEKLTEAKKKVEENAKLRKENAVYLSEVASLKGELQEQKESSREELARRDEHLKKLSQEIEELRHENAARDRELKNVSAVPTSAPKSKPSGRTIRREKGSDAEEGDKENGEDVEPAPAVAPKGRVRVKAVRSKATALATVNADVDEPDNEPVAPRNKRKRPLDEADAAPPSPAKRVKVDPNSLTKPQLKSELTKMGIKLPTKDMPKQTYVDLFCQSVQ